MQALDRLVAPPLRARAAPRDPWPSPLRVPLRTSAALPAAAVARADGDAPGPSIAAATGDLREATPRLPPAGQADLKAVIRPPSIGTAMQGGAIGNAGITPRRHPVAGSRLLDPAQADLAAPLDRSHAALKPRTSRRAPAVLDQPLVPAPAAPPATARPPRRLAPVSRTGGTTALPAVGGPLRIIKKKRVVERRVQTKKKTIVREVVLRPTPWPAPASGPGAPARVISPISPSARPKMAVSATDGQQITPAGRPGAAARRPPLSATDPARSSLPAHAGIRVRPANAAPEGRAVQAAPPRPLPASARSTEGAVPQRAAGVQPQGPRSPVPVTAAAQRPAAAPPARAAPPSVSITIGRIDIIARAQAKPPLARPDARPARSHAIDPGGPTLRGG